MDIYSLVVESFTIHDTRSAINDTLWLNVSAFVDGDMVDSWSEKLGDFDNGTHPAECKTRGDPSNSGFGDRGSKDTVGKAVREAFGNFERTAVRVKNILS